MMLRVLRQAPAYSAAILGMLTLSTVVLIGTAVQVDAALFRPPEFPGVDRLVIVYNLESAPGRPDRRVRWSYRGVSLLRQLAAPSLEVANYSPSLLPLTLESEAEAVTAEIVSPGYFALLEAAPVIGRGFRPDEDSVPGAGPVTVLSHGLWQRRFGGDSGIVGRQVRVSGTQLTVIGVMGPRFHGLSGNAALWVPAAMAPTLSYPEYLTSDQHFISAVGRLRPGVGLQQADRQLELVGQAITSQLDSGTTGATVRTSAIPLNQARINGSTRRSLLLLLAGASLLHLLAIANVVNLMLARAAARQREAAILVAIGGSTWQRLRYFATEGMAFSFLATGIGLVIAWAATPLLAIPADAWGPRSLYGSLATFSTVEFGVRELVLALLLGTGTALLVTWAPVVALLHPSLGAMQRDGGGISRGGATLRRPSLRGVIVAVEAGLAMVLLVAGGLLIESYRRMRATDLGIEPDHVLSFWIRPSESRVPTDQAPAFVARVLSAIEALPGVEAATVDGGGPLSGSARSTLIIARHPPARPEDAPPILRHYVGPNHFRVLGVPLLRGRAFDQRDRAGSPRVVVISESAARRFWPNSDPIGERVWFGGGSNFNSAETSGEIVGIVGDVAYEPLDVGSNRASFYTPYQQFTYAARAVLVRTAGDPMALVPAVRRAVATLDPDLPIVEVRSLRDQIGASWARQRFEALIFGLYAGAALLLATLGVYAVVAFSVSRRSQEMGIRLALGAEPGAIRRQVAREGMIYPALGLVAGFGASIAVSRMLQSSLYEVAPGEIRFSLLALGLLALAAAAGCLVPASRATRIDPAVTLRAD